MSSWTQQLGWSVVSQMPKCVHVPESTTFSASFPFKLWPRGIAAAGKFWNPAPNVSNKEIQSAVKYQLQVRQLRTGTCAIVSNLQLMFLSLTNVHTHTHTHTHTHEDRFSLPETSWLAPENATAPTWSAAKKATPNKHGHLTCICLLCKYLYHVIINTKRLQTIVLSSADIFYLDFLVFTVLGEL